MVWIVLVHGSLVGFIKFVCFCFILLMVCVCVYLVHTLGSVTQGKDLRKQGLVLSVFSFKENRSTYFLVIPSTWELKAGGWNRHRNT